MSGVAESLERAFRELAEPGVVSVYLFGSHAEARSHRESDVDVGVLLRLAVHPTPRDRFEVRLRLSAELAVRLGTDRVDVVVLNDAPPELGRRIVSRGRRAFCADPSVDHAFVRDVQLRAADLDPFLRRARRTKLAAIAR
jgi:predicted nucleotidyltransferase